MTSSGERSQQRPLPQRPLPIVTRDNAFFWDGIQRGELLLQRCTACGTLRHPPGPMCPRCHELGWDTLRAGGLGRVYSYCVAHEPRVPGFDPPYVVALIELTEGPRLVSNLIDIDPATVRIGMAVCLQMVAVDPELTLPLFRPADDE